jgi:hypothetical protein
MLIIGIVALSRYLSAIAMDSEKNTSILQGKDWVNDLLAGHPTRFFDAMGLRKPIF